jgi:hypothetical protein
LAVKPVKSEGRIYLRQEKIHKISEKKNISRKFQDCANDSIKLSDIYPVLARHPQETPRYSNTHFVSSSNARNISPQVPDCGSTMGPDGDCRTKFCGATQKNAEDGG